MAMRTHIASSTHATARPILTFFIRAYFLSTYYSDLSLGLISLIMTTVS